MERTKTSKTLLNDRIHWVYISSSSSWPSAWRDSQCLNSDEMSTPQSWAETVKILLIPYPKIQLKSRIHKISNSPHIQHCCLPHLLLSPRVRSRRCVSRRQVGSRLGWVTRESFPMSFKVDSATVKLALSTGRKCKNNYPDKDRSSQLPRIEVSIWHLEPWCHFSPLLQTSLILFWHLPTWLHSPHKDRSLLELIYRCLDLSKYWREDPWKKLPRSGQKCGN